MSLDSFFGEFTQIWKFDVRKFTKQEMPVGDISVNWTKIQIAAMGTILVRGTRYFGYKLVIIPSFYNFSSKLRG